MVSWWEVEVGRSCSGGIVSLLSVVLPMHCVADVAVNDKLTGQTTLWDGSWWLRWARVITPTHATLSPRGISVLLGIGVFILSTHGHGPWGYTIDWSFLACGANLLNSKPIHYKNYSLNCTCHQIMFVAKEKKIIKFLFCVVYAWSLIYSFKKN